MNEGTDPKLDRIHRAHDRLEPALGFAVGFGRGRAGRIEPELDPTLELGQEPVRHRLKAE